MSLSPMVPADAVSLPRRAIGVDIGGTKIAAGVVTCDGEALDEIVRVPTPTSQAALLESIRALIDNLRDRFPDVSAVGVGAAGLIDWPHGRIRWAPNNAYRSLPLREILEAATGLPTIVDNDANAAAWAERRVSRDSGDMVFLTVGTGVGAGLVFAGTTLHRGRSGIAAEVGHMIVDPHGGYRCGCGNVGCLEAVASGTALGRYGREAAASDPDGVIAKLAGGPEAVTGHVVHQAARLGDPTAVSLFRRVGTWLGIGIVNLVVTLELDVVVVGGGLVTADDLLLAPVRSTVEGLLAHQHRDLPTIVQARLGSDAGWIGAGLLALDRTGSEASPDRLVHDAVEVAL